jgi:hypothetical protein
MCIDIAAGGAPTTLHEFSQQTGLQLLFDYRAVRGCRYARGHCEADATRALTRMLSGTGLAFEFVNEKTISVVSMRRLSERSRRAASAVARVDNHDDSAILLAQNTDTPPPRVRQPRTCRTRGSRRHRSKAQ